MLFRIRLYKTLRLAIPNVFMFEGKIFFKSVYRCIGYAEQYKYKRAQPKTTVQITFEKLKY